MNPDIICLQELDEVNSKFLKEEYEGVFQQKSIKNKYGNGIYIKRELFDIVNYSVQQFNYKIDFLDYYCNIQFIFIRDRRNQFEFVVFNTHLPFYPKYNLNKLFILIYFKNFIHHNKIKYFVFCGDFNFTPNSDLYQYMQDNVIRIDSEN